MSLLTDPAFYVHTIRYASDEEAFFADFSSAFSRLGELGWSELHAVDYQIPSQVDNVTLGAAHSLSLKAGMQLECVLNVDGNMSVKLTLDAVVAWMALGVSATGQMVDPTPSFAVIGQQSGVNRHFLVHQDQLNIEHSAPLDVDQSIFDASFSYYEGSTELAFRIPLQWFVSYLSADDSLWLIFSHGDKARPEQPFGYHGLNRGHLLIGDFVGLFSLPVAAPPRVASLVARDFNASESVRLTWTHWADATTTYRPPSPPLAAPCPQAAR